MGILSLLIRGVTGSMFSWVPYAACGAALIGVALLYYHAKSSGRSDAEAGFVRAELASQQAANERLLSQVAKIETLASKYRARERDRNEQAAGIDAKLREWESYELQPGQCSPDCTLPEWLLEVD